MQCYTTLLWSIIYILPKFRGNTPSTFQVILLTNRQTVRKTEPPSKVAEVITDQYFAPATATPSDSVVRLDGLAASITLACTVPFHPVMGHRLKYHTHPARMYESNRHLHSQIISQVGNSQVSGTRMSVK